MMSRYFGLRSELNGAILSGQGSSFNQFVTYIYMYTGQPPKAAPIWRMILCPSRRLPLLGGCSYAPLIYYSKAKIAYIDANTVVIGYMNLNWL